MALDKWSEHGLVHKPCELRSTPSLDVAYVLSLAAPTTLMLCMNGWNSVTSGFSSCAFRKLSVRVSR